MCISYSTPLGSLQRFEGATGEFKGALGSRLQIISSPVKVKEYTQIPTCGGCG